LVELARPLPWRASRFRRIGASPRNVGCMLLYCDRFRIIEPRIADVAGGPPMSELQFQSRAAEGYDMAVGRISSKVVPLLIQEARIAPGMTVLDIAGGT